MRRQFIFLICLSAALSLTGCGGSGGKSAGQRNIFFPSEVAGIWSAYDQPWVIELSKDGNVISAMIPFGVEIWPNDTTEAEMVDGNTISTYEAGDCPVEFNPLTRELTVTIVLKALHVKFPGGDRIDGNSTDLFTGRVSEDGREWYADWYTYFDWGPNFPQDRNEPNDVYMGQVLFEKVIRRPQSADSNMTQGTMWDEVEMMLKPRIPADSNAVHP